jgi:hypothetical protein
VNPSRGTKPEMNEREGRLVQNEALFRSVNERIEDIHEDLGRVEESDWVCECGDGNCVERVRLSHSEYERIRGHSDWFLIKPGHQIPDVERVAEDHGTYLVVEKFEEAIERAEELDERT